MWGVVYEPEKIVPGTPYPDDFMDFWKNAIATYDREVTAPIEMREEAKDDLTVLLRRELRASDQVPNRLRRRLY